MENLKSNSWLIDSKCGECFRKEMKCCLQQMEVCKFSFHFRARITVSGDVSESKNSKKSSMIIITGGRKRKGSHCYESLIPKRKASPQRRRPDPFFLFLLRYPLSSVSSFYLYYLPIFPPPFRFFHILSLFPVPVSSLCLCFVPLHPPPFSMLSRLHPPQRLSDVALGLKKSRFIEFLAL